MWRAECHFSEESFLDFIAYKQQARDKEGVFIDQSGQSFSKERGTRQMQRADREVAIIRGWSCPQDAFVVFLIDFGLWWGQTKF